MRAVRFFCAICTSDIDSDAPRQAPLGKNAALVNVCDDCFDEPAHEHRGHQIGYSSPIAQKGSIGRLVRNAMVRVGVRSGDAKGEQRRACAPMYRGVSPGFDVCRVSRAVGGRLIDQKTAWKIAVERWGHELKFVGQTARYYVYQRPNPVELAKSGLPVDNPLAEISRFEAKRRAQ